MIRCPYPAVYGITTGDYTENACAEHALTVIDRLAPPGKTVMVYQIQADRRCDHTRLTLIDEIYPEKSR